MSDKPITFHLTVSVVVNSQDGTRQDALDHLGQMIAWHGLEGVQMTALEPVRVLIQRTDYEFELDYEPRHDNMTAPGGGSGRQI